MCDLCHIKCASVNFENRTEIKQTESLDLARWGLNASKIALALESSVSVRQAWTILDVMFCGEKFDVFLFAYFLLVCHSWPVRHSSFHGRWIWQKHVNAYGQGNLSLNSFSLLCSGKTRRRTREDELPGRLKPQ